MTKLDTRRPCPRCHSSNVVCKDKDRYRCKECGKTYYKAEDRMKYLRDSSNPCPRCGSLSTRKDGLTAARNQRFKCRECGRRFNVDRETRTKARDLKTMKLVRMYNQNVGLSMRSLRTNFHLGTETIRNMLNGTYKYKEKYEDR